MTGQPAQFYVERYAKRKAKRTRIATAKERLADEFNGDIKEVFKELSYLRDKVQHQQERAEHDKKRHKATVANNRRLSNAWRLWRYKAQEFLKTPSTTPFGHLTEAEYLIITCVLSQYKATDNKQAFINRLKFAIGADPLSKAKWPIEFIPEAEPEWLSAPKKEKKRKSKG